MKTKVNFCFVLCKSTFITQRRHLKNIQSHPRVIIHLRSADHTRARWGQSPGGPPPPFPPRLLPPGGSGAETWKTVTVHKATRPPPRIINTCPPPSSSTPLYLDLSLRCARFAPQGGAELSRAVSGGWRRRRGAGRGTARAATETNKQTLKRGHVTATRTGSHTLA